MMIMTKSLRKDLQEFVEVAQEIILHPLFQGQRSFTHHKSSLYHHTISVAFLSYQAAKRFKLDTNAVIRGALLHDFFLYDWHIEGKRVKKRLFKKHGFTHARIAFENASFFFDLNKKEKDIILKHMFPLNLKPPLYLESWIVNSVDNLITFKEYFFKKPSKVSLTIDKLALQMRKKTQD